MQYPREETEVVVACVYEYFLHKFCIAAKSEKGEFYTSGNIVELMTLLIQPYSGSVYEINIENLIQFDAHLAA